MGQGYLEVLAIVLVVMLPSAVVVAYPFTGGPTPENTCTVHISTFTPKEMRGRYDSNDWAISFSITLEKDTVSSVTTFHNTSAGEEGATDIRAKLSFPNTQERQIPGMTKMIIDSALQVAQESDCNIPDEISTYYQEFADALYKCTMDMGASQFRFSVMYHSAILALLTDFAPVKKRFAVLLPSTNLALDFSFVART